MVSSDNSSLNRSEQAFPSISIIPNTIWIYDTQSRIEMTKSIIIVTALYHHSVPTQLLAHPVMFTRRQLARKKISCKSCIIPGASASRRHLWLLGVGGNLNRSSVCLLASWEQHWEKLLLTNQCRLVDSRLLRTIYCPLGRLANGWTYHHDSLFFCLIFFRRIVNLR